MTTGSASTSKTSSRKIRQDEGFGARLRHLRRLAGLTLQQMSERTGLASSTISKVENNQISPTYENIIRLAEGLRVDVAELFNRQPSAMATGRLDITRSGEGVKHATQQYAYEMLCSGLSHKHFLPLVTTLRARTVEEFPDLLRHTGEEFIYVMSGEVELHTEHYKPVRLKPGDSCYFDSGMGHACISKGEEDAVVLWVCSRVEPPLSD